MQIQSLSIGSCGGGSREKEQTSNAWLGKWPDNKLSVGNCIKPSSGELVISFGGSLYKTKLTKGPKMTWKGRNQFKRDSYSEVPSPQWRSHLCGIPTVWESLTATIQQLKWGDKHILEHYQHRLRIIHSESLPAEWFMEWNNGIIKNWPPKVNDCHQDEDLLHLTSRPSVLMFRIGPSCKRQMNQILQTEL